MKKLLLILAVVLVSCSAEDTTQTEQEQTCYTIVLRGYDNRGDYIIIKYANFINKRYSVGNYLDYMNTDKICEPINLTEQQL